MTPQQLASMTADIFNNGYASFETRHRRKDGRLIDAMVSVRTLQLQERDYLLAIWRDINHCGQRVRDRAMQDMDAGEREQLFRLLSQVLHNLTPTPAND